jgi:hypothetical protein
MHRDTDLMRAAFMIARGAELNDYERKGVRHCVFFLQGLGDEEFKALRNQWMRGVAMVNAVAYMEAIRKLKKIIHEDERDRWTDL